MIREFSEEKKDELYILLDAINNKECNDFTAWCGNRVYEFGDWMNRLDISSYTNQIYIYNKNILDINSSTKTQIDTIFNNVAEVDRRYQGIFQNYASTVKQQLDKVFRMQMAMSTARGDSEEGDGGYSDSNTSITYALERWIESTNDISKYFSSCDKEIQIAISLLDAQICSRLGIYDIDERVRIIQTLLEENLSTLKDIYILNNYSSADYQKVINNVLFDIEIENGYITEQGLMFLYELELGPKSSWRYIDILRVDDNGNIIAIRIHDVGDGGYTLGPGIYINENYAERIEEAELLGIDWNNTDEWVSMENVIEMFDYIRPEYEGKIRNIERKTNKVLNSEQYDAVFTLTYLSPNLSNCIVDLINTDADKETWTNNLINQLKEQNSQENWEAYGNGWTDRIERTVELYFNGSY